MGCILRVSAIYVAIAAMSLRGLLPIGWMPNPTGTGPLIVLCTAEGPMPFLFGPDGKPVKPDSRHNGHHHDICPFNAAPHFAVAAASAFVAQPSIDYIQARVLTGYSIAPQLQPYEPQSPRAPPFPV